MLGLYFSSQESPATRINHEFFEELINLELAYERLLIDLFSFQCLAYVAPEDGSPVAKVKALCFEVSTLKVILFLMSFQISKRHSVKKNTLSFFL